MFICPTCSGSYKSYKSLHRHKTTKHPETIGLSTLQTRVQHYLQAPVSCTQCNLYLDYDSRHNKFCDAKCAALHNNALIDKEAVNLKRKDTWRKKLGILQSEIVKEPTVTLGTCPTCQSTFTKRGTRHAYCKPSCNTSKFSKVHYRMQCKFRLNPQDHTHLYDFDLIARVGWYVPSNKGTYNPDGVTWDHLYRIEDGFINDVSPEIMSHPANAEMVSWRDNQKRKTSQITLEQLLERIKNWPN